MNINIIYLVKIRVPTLYQAVTGRLYTVTRNLNIYSILQLFIDFTDFQSLIIIPIEPVVRRFFDTAVTIYALFGEQTDSDIQFAGFLKIFRQSIKTTVVFVAKRHRVVIFIRNRVAFYRIIMPYPSPLRGGNTAYAVIDGVIVLYRIPPCRFSRIDKGIGLYIRQTISSQRIVCHLDKTNTLRVREIVHVCPLNLEHIILYQIFLFRIVYFPRNLFNPIVNKRQV